MPLLRFGGAGDKHVVILHATGFLSAAYQPLAAALGKEFVVWGLDLPGHGSAVDVRLPGDGSTTHSSNKHSGGNKQHNSACCSTPAPSPSSSSADGSGPPDINLTAVTAYIIQTIQQAGLQGCFAFGHSAGGALALLAASECPALFKAVYCFEAVASTPASHAFMAAATASGDISTDGQVLGSIARKRRALFNSRQEAQQHLGSKPPFSRMHPAAVGLYLQHGLVEVDTAGDTPAAAHAGRQQQQQQGCWPPAAAPQQQQQHQQLHQQTVTAGVHQPVVHLQQDIPQAAAAAMLPPQRKQQTTKQQQAVQLVCSPEQEAAYFDALQPPPAFDPCSVHCPVLLAVAAPAAGSTPAAALSTHEGVSQWFYQHSSTGSNKRQLHGSLRVLNCELAAAMPTAQLLEVESVSHFGPLEQPELLADSCAAFYNNTMDQQLSLSSKL